MTVDHRDRDSDHDAHGGDASPLAGELSALRPRPLPADLAARILDRGTAAAAAPRANRRADRCLRVAIGLAAAAACVIAGTLITEPGGGLPAEPIAAINVS